MVEDVYPENGGTRISGIGLNWDIYDMVKLGSQGYGLTRISRIW